MFIEDVADGFYETDLRGNFTFFNDAMCRIFGYSGREILNRNFREFMDEKNAEIAFSHFNRIYRSDEALTDILWEISRKDGQTAILEISANLIIGKDGSRSGFRGIARDVTENHLARKELEESRECAFSLYQASHHAERRHRALLDFLPDPIFAFNPDGTVSYLNPAFERVFGWKMEELKGKHIPFVPDFLKKETRQGFRRLSKEKILYGFETRRLTKDGQLLDIMLNAAIFYEDEKENASGQVAVLRDITRENRMIRSNESLFRIAKALPRFQRINELLEFIVREVKELIAAEGASVILLDEKKKEFFFPVANYDNAETGNKMKELRFPADKGVAGHVYKTGQPLIVPDTSESPFFFQNVDDQSDYRTRNMLDVPIRTQDRMIGVLCAVNKKEGVFDQDDVELLSAVAGAVALPIENARINEELKRSYEEVRSLNRAKERVIHHLSHELKTPLSVLDASLKLLQKKLSRTEDRGWGRILERAGRNLHRLLEMQYGIEDILREKKYKAAHMLSLLLDVCADELEVLFESEIGNSEFEIGDSAARKFIQNIRERIEQLFGPHKAVVMEIRPDVFVREKLEKMAPRFAHRQCRITPLILPVRSVLIPEMVLDKVVEGLIRNAVENTPDHGMIEVVVRDGGKWPEFEVRDFGVGITQENRLLIFESNFSTRETMQYSSGHPYDFNAGGKGFDLLRMKIFSERYDFSISMKSERCGFIPGDANICPGDIRKCEHCRTPEDCFHSGGTSVSVRFG